MNKLVDYVFVSCLDTKMNTKQYNTNTSIVIFAAKDIIIVASTPESFEAMK